MTRSAHTSSIAVGWQFAAHWINRNDQVPSGQNQNSTQCVEFDPSKNRLTCIHSSNARRGDQLQPNLTHGIKSVLSPATVASDP